ncbi:Bacterial extracellular solute-binding protein, family 5 Middle [Rubrobacter radiotolerans]|uniref:Bacterial extracellular solute-binding protein, family 5 Middle n=1 Tax=Rubrobacter radiotolerans TaxID=42256 RepID=A0A023X5A4_RUBRA|nr:Bacterial extracellular solute-binding protein, family 5 Middle [Rubrobacter radiotolerans]
MLEANTDHWNKERGPRLERIVYLNDVPQEEALEKVCNTEGEVDLVSEVTPDQARKVLDSEHAKLVTIDAMRILSGLINRDRDFMSDVRIRRALNHAVDKERLINDLLGGYAHPVAAMSPPYSGAPEDIEPYAYDPEKAKSLFREAEWPEGRPLVVATTSDVAAVADFLAGSFRESLGVEVELVSVPDERLVAAQKALIEKKIPQTFDVLVHAWFDLAAGYPPAVIHREYYHSGGAFRLGPPVEEFEDLMARSLVETDASRLGDLGRDLDRLTHREALSVFLCCPMALVAVNKHVSFTGHAATLELCETEVGEEHWSRR